VNYIRKSFCSNC